MTIRECYQAIDADFEDAYRRSPNEALIRKFALKFTEDKSMAQLTEALRSRSAEEAFRAAHIIKGLCLNLGFSSMAAPACELTELLRGGKMDGCEPVYGRLAWEHEKTVRFLKQMD